LSAGFSTIGVEECPFARNAGIADGGNLGYILQEFENEYMDNSSGRSLFSHGSLGFRVLDRMVEVGGEIFSVYTVYNPEILNYFDEYVRYRSNKELAGGPLNVGIVAICEPLKVRTISKGPPFTYYRAITLQKEMWSVIHDFAVFQYIGHPIVESDFARTFRPLRYGEKYISGDYKASTDNINPEYTKLVWKILSKNIRLQSGRYLIDDELYELGERCLTGHRMNYPDDLGFYDRTGETGVNQAWGQLMGSPMSFPILNLINYIGTCVALNWDPLDPNPCRTNGDDIGFICAEKDYKKWCYVMSCVGLERSIGKNYVSEDFLILNSELRYAPRSQEETFYIEGDNGHEECFWGPTEWTYRGFFNQGLFWGVNHKGIFAGERQWLVWPELGPIVKQLLRGIPEKRAVQFYEMYRIAHHYEFSKIPSGCSYHLPLELGGAGLPYGDPNERELTTATVMFLNHERRLKRPLLKTELGVFQRISKPLRASFTISKLHKMNFQQSAGPSNSTLLLEFLKGYDEELRGLIKKENVTSRARQKCSGLSQEHVACSLRQYESQSLMYNYKWRKWTKKTDRVQIHPLTKQHWLSFVEHWTKAITVGTFVARKDPIYEPIEKGELYHSGVTSVLADYARDLVPRIFHAQLMKQLKSLF